MIKNLYKSSVYLSLIACALIIAAEYSSLLFAQDPFLRRGKESAPYNEGEKSLADLEKEEIANSVKAELDSEAEQEAESAHNIESANNAGPGHKTSTRKAIFPGYAAYRASLADYCKYLALDGHQKRVQDVLDKLLLEKNECSPCRQLYRALSCKVSKIVATPKPKVAEPSTELLAALSSIFADIAARTELASITAENLQPLLKELAVPLDKVSTAYFEIFIAYIKNPLKQYLEQVNKSDQKKEQKAKDKELEALF